MEMIQSNVRLPEEVFGDLMGHITCNQVGERYLLEFMDEYDIEDLESLSQAITSQTERSMREKIRDIPDGVYRSMIQAEGSDEPLSLACSVTVSGDGVHIDFSGTGPSVSRGINVPLCYTRAFSLFSVKALTIPEIPNNEGATNPITVSAPAGCILNTLPPSPTGGRNVIGHFVTPLIFAALEDVLPERVQADCGMINQIAYLGTHRDGRVVSTVFFASGGYGAQHGLDGAPVTPGPGNMIACPVEVMEQNTCITTVRKELLADSGGAGEFRGGVGQEILLRNDSQHPLQISGLAGRSEFAPIGRRGGKAGILRQYRLNGQVVHTKGRYTMQPGDTLLLTEAGGGGFGDPRARDPAQVLADVANGYVSETSASRDYGVEVDRPNKAAGRP
jgi:N-methylhydantoinase B